MCWWFLCCLFGSHGMLRALDHCVIQPSREAQDLPTNCWWGLFITKPVRCVSCSVPGLQWRKGRRNDMAGNFWGCGCALSSSEFGWKPQANHICITKKGPRNKNKLIEYWLVHFNSYWIWLHFLLKCQAWDSDNIRGFCPSSTTHSSWVTLRKSVNPLSSNEKPGSWILSFKTSQWNVLEGSLTTRLGTKAPGVNKPGFWFFTFAPWPWTSSLTSQNLRCPMVKWRGGSYLIGPSRETKYGE